ncbi:hypothetical protein EGM51_16600 [Verrucomicrobia bacterium S94]|nr:hypothetical protein EGM51_16600 [Verrucomicrobia bacterium S94]
MRTSEKTGISPNRFITLPMHSTSHILIGNAFPLTLVKRAVRIVPVSQEVLREAARGKTVVSFWGHANTLAAAEAFCGLPLLPASPRPALELSVDGLPRLNGQTFSECWIVSPEYTAGYRPEPGAEVPADNIIGWKILKITWE